MKKTKKLQKSFNLVSVSDLNSKMIFTNFNLRSYYLESQCYI